MLVPAWFTVTDDRTVTTGAEAGQGGASGDGRVAAWGAHRGAPPVLRPAARLRPAPCSGRGYGDAGAIEKT